MYIYAKKPKLKGDFVPLPLDALCLFSYYSNISQITPRS